MHEKLKKQLEQIRGMPIPSFSGRPGEAPCIETSDSERLCQHPVVSVRMITYNHESYIRQAIDGILMQTTDFEYELVIGEDCSTDKTREICFEYQKKYPDKIRVLWSDYNLYRNPHPAGGNGVRTTYRCRGKYIAFCEGDDYWTDSHKLQKQVDAFRANPTVGICISGAKILIQQTGQECDYDLSAFPKGFIAGSDFWRIHALGLGQENFIVTATVMVGRDVLEKATALYDIMNWRLSLSDTTTWQGVSTLSDAYVIDDAMAVYRRHGGGATATSGGLTGLDGLLSRLYFCVVYLGVDIGEALSCFANRIAIQRLHTAKKLNSVAQRQCAREIVGDPLSRILFHSVFSRPGLKCMQQGLLNDSVAFRTGQILYHFGMPFERRRLHRFVEKYFS